jgi:hypothetical protein
MTSVTAAQTRPGKSWVERILGILNLLFAAVGLVALLINFLGFHNLPSSFTGESPFLYRTLYPMSAASLILLVCLGYSGFQLLRGGRFASIICGVVFSAEIVFFVAYSVFWRLPFSPISVVAVAAGLTNLGLALQIVTGYPVVGLISLRFLQPRGR